MARPLNDQELARFLALSPDEAAIVIPKLTPARRAVYDKMYEVERWDKGFGPMPDGVVICGGCLSPPKKRRK